MKLLWAIKFEVAMVLSIIAYLYIAKFAAENIQLF